MAGMSYQWKLVDGWAQNLDTLRLNPVAERCGPRGLPQANPWGPAMPPVVRHRRLPANLHAHLHISLSVCLSASTDCLCGDRKEA